MTDSLRDYPHLPVLTLEQCMAVITRSNLSFTMLASSRTKPGLLPYSRQSLYLWRRGRNPHRLALDQVSTLAYRVLAAARAKTLPAGKNPQLDAVRAALSAVDLNALRAEDILPKTWIKSTTT